MKHVTVTYFLDVISSWCHWAEPAWADLKHRFRDVADFQWKIALMDPSGLPATREEEEWYYRRSGTLMRSPYLLNAGWFQPGMTEYIAPNAVPLAARELGAEGDAVRIAVARAGMIDGLKFSDWEVSVSAALSVAGLDRNSLTTLARSERILRMMRESTAEFHSLKMTVRPAFLVENRIGDRAVFSGLANLSPVAAAIEVLHADAVGYQSYAAHHGGPPSKPV